MTDPANTTPAMLMRAAEIARRSGLRYVYAGNQPGRVGELEHTHCAGCGERLIARYGYFIQDYGLQPDGSCPHCRVKIPGIWSRPLRRTAHGNPLSAARSHAPFRDMKPGVIQDIYGRPLRNLRVSVTDRCNLRCAYCMPEKDYVWLPREDMLQFEEIETLVDVFLDAGVDKVRLTGGEPLLRRDLPVLIERLAARARIRDLALTTNGVLLAEHAQALRDSGLHRLTVSLDTLRHDRFTSLARFNELDRVIRGIDAAGPIFGGLKIDTVVIRGVNDDELVDLIAFGRARDAEVRFIEYMDVGGATQWSMDRVVSRAQMLDAHRAAVWPCDRAAR